MMKRILLIIIVGISMSLANIMEYHHLEDERQTDFQYCKDIQASNPSTHCYQINANSQHQKNGKISTMQNYLQTYIGNFKKYSLFGYCQVNESDGNMEYIYCYRHQDGVRKQLTYGKVINNENKKIRYIQEVGFMDEQNKKKNVVKSKVLKTYSMKETANNPDLRFFD